MKRSQGHNVGYGLLATSALSALLGVTRNAARAGPLAIAAASLAGGVYFLNRLYLDDPEALEEYRRIAQTHAVSYSIRYFGSMEKLLKVLPAKELRLMVDDEIGDKGLAKVLANFSVQELKQLTHYDIIARGSLHSLFLRDCMNHKIFSTLWAELCRAHKNVDELAELGAFDARRARELLQAEFPFIDIEDASKRASAPTEEDGNDFGQYDFEKNGKGNLFTAVNSYAPFCETRMGVPPEFFRAVLMSSSIGRRASFEQIMQTMDGLPLFKKGLLDPVWVDVKLSDAVESKRIDLWRHGSALSIVPALQAGMIRPATAAPLFTRGVPRIASSSTDEHSNIVAFVDKWRFLFQQFPELLEEYEECDKSKTSNQLANTVHDFYQSFVQRQQRLKEKFDRDLSYAADAAARNIERVDRLKGRISNEELAAAKEEEKRRAAEEEYRLRQQHDEELRRLRIDTHNDFVMAVKRGGSYARPSWGGGSHVGCAQQ